MEVLDVTATKYDELVCLIPWRNRFWCWTTFCAEGANCKGKERGERREEGRVGVNRAGGGRMGEKGRVEG